LLRLVVCAVSLLGAVVAHRHRQGLPARFVLGGLLRNRILPAHLTQVLRPFIVPAVAPFFAPAALMRGETESGVRRLGGR
jgi:hypothetical protein